MITKHSISISDSRSLDGIRDDSVDLVVTSPPYPMIEMWDAVFSHLNPAIGEALDSEDGTRAFDLMHEELAKTWRECNRVLRPGGILCINVGDATRTIGKDFQLYPNCARTIEKARRFGFTMLPKLIWRKPGNSPNKYKGSGMLPAGAYVTHEHEDILVFRKGLRRSFKSPDEKRTRRESALFWEERNNWYSDLWQEVQETGQNIGTPGVRSRSGAFPVEIPHRLILMHSVYGDTVLDPFLGTGTTSLAAAILGRNSIGIEIEASLKDVIDSTLRFVVGEGQARVEQRLRSQQAFVASREAVGDPCKFRNRHYGFPVVSSHETDLVVYQLKRIRKTGNDTLEFEHRQAELPAAVPTLELPF